MKHKAFEKMKRQYELLKSEMTPGNKDYDALQERLYFLKEDAERREMEYAKVTKKYGTNITKTLFWHWQTEKGFHPESFFYATPPIGEAKESNRILITGTNRETSDMYKIIEGLKTYRRVMREIRGSQELSESTESGLLATKSIEEYGFTPEYVFASQLGTFWKRFFGDENFLDNEVSVPRAIIGTGYMRNYNRRGGETVYGAKRLEEIASDWNLSIEFIETWAP